MDAHRKFSVEIAIVLWQTLHCSYFILLGEFEKNFCYCKEHKKSCYSYEIKTKIKTPRKQIFKSRLYKIES